MRSRSSVIPGEPSRPFNFLKWPLKSKGSKGKQNKVLHLQKCSASEFATEILKLNYRFFFVLTVLDFFYTENVEKLKSVLVTNDGATNLNAL